jgi:hypothetical protein
MKKKPLFLAAAWRRTLEHCPRSCRSQKQWSFGHMAGGGETRGNISKKRRRGVPSSGREGGVCGWTKRSGEGRTKLRMGRMYHLVGDEVGRGGVHREEGEGDRKTTHHGKIRKLPTGRARKRIETGRLNKKWMGGHAKALCNERSRRERESSAEGIPHPSHTRPGSPRHTHPSMDAIGRISDVRDVITRFRKCVI